MPDSNKNPLSLLTEYELRHLAAHLAVTGRDNELHCLLAMETAQGRNAWYEVRETTDDIQGYLADVALAWELAEATGNIAQQIKYALCQSSIVSIAAHYPPKLLALAVQYQCLTPRQAMAIASQISSEERAETLLKLVPHLPETLLEEALNLVQSLADKKDQAKALIGLAPYLPETLLIKALIMARGIDDEEAQAGTLARLVPLLPEGLQSEAVPEALVAVRSIEDEKWRATVLTELAQNLPAARQEECLVIAQSIEHASIRAWAITKLAPSLPQDLRTEALLQALAAARGFENSETFANLAQAYSQVEILTHFAPYLQGKSLQVALLTAGALIGNGALAEMLVNLTLYLPGVWQKKILHYALKIKRVTKISFVRSYQQQEELPYISRWLRLVQYLPKAVAKKVFQNDLQEAPRVGNGRVVWILTEQLSQFPETVHKEMIPNLLAIARLVGDKRAQDNLLIDLIPHLPEDLQRESLHQILKEAGPPTGMMRGIVLATLIALLPDTLRKEGRRYIRTSGFDFFLAHTLFPSEIDNLLRSRLNSILGELTPHLPVEVIWAAIWDMIFFPPHLLHGDTKAERQFLETILAHAVQFAQHIDDERRAKILRKIGPYLSQALIVKVLTIVRTIHNEHEQAEILASLAPHLSEVLQEEVLEIVQSGRDIRLKTTVLTHLLPHLSESLSGKAWEIIQTIKNTSIRAELLLALAPRLPKALQVEIADNTLVSVQPISIHNNITKAKLLATLAPYLPEARKLEILHDALVAAQAIRPARDHVIALTKLIPHLPESLQIEVVEDTLTTARSIRNQEYRIRALADVALHLPNALRAEVLQEALLTAQLIKNPSSRFKIMLELAPHLPNALQEALKIAQTAQQVWEQENVLADQISSLPECLRDEALPAAMQTTLQVARLNFREIAPPIKEGKSRLLTSLTSHLSTITQSKPDLAFFIWTRTLHQLSTHPRHSFLYILHDLLPFVLALARHETELARDIFHTIQTVARWWP